MRRDGGFSHGVPIPGNFYEDEYSGGGGGSLVQPEDDGSCTSAKLAIRESLQVPRLKALSQRLVESYKNDSHINHKRMLILFIGLPSEVVEKEIIPRTKYWHYRSGSYADLASFGFNSKKPKPGSESYYVRILEELESELDWSHSGGTDIIVLNSVFDPVAQEVKLDFSTAVSLTIEKAKEDGAITNVSIFIEDLLRSARVEAALGPSWKASDDLGIDKAKSALWNLLVSFLPEAFRKEAKGAKNFYVKDLRRKKIF